MDALEFISELKRMCDSYKCCSLSPCPLYKDGIFKYCQPQGIYTDKDIEHVLEIVEKWSKEHPKRTYLSVLLEKFPKTVLNEFGIPSFCPSYLGFKEFQDTRCGEYEGCENCWNKEYKE